MAGNFLQLDSDMTNRHYKQLLRFTFYGAQRIGSKIESRGPRTLEVIIHKYLGWYI